MENLSEKLYLMQLKSADLTLSQLDEIIKLFDHFFYKSSNKISFQKQFASSCPTMKAIFWLPLAKLIPKNPYLFQPLSQHRHLMEEEVLVTLFESLMKTYPSANITTLDVYSIIKPILSLKRNCTLEMENQAIDFITKNISFVIDEDHHLFLKREFKNPDNLLKIYSYSNEVFVLKNLAVHPQMTLYGKQEIIILLRKRITSEPKNKNNELLIKIINSIHKSLGNSPEETLTKLLS